jgi:hypothetical protein
LHLQHYKIYFIGEDGRFFKAIDIDCGDGAAAVAETKAMVDGHDLELWQSDRRIARFDGKPQ